MAKAERREQPPKIQPPMTPMIDCVFQLIIFFMLIPNQQAGEGYLTTNLPTDLGPRDLGGPPPDIQYVRIELHDQGPEGKGVRIVLNDRQVLGANFETLRAALEDLKRRALASAFPVLIEPTRATRHRWVVRAMDAAVAARFEDIRFAVP